MQIRRFVAVACGLALLAAHVSMAASKPATEKSLRFYGRIISVNANQGNLTVHNKKKNEDATFQMNEETKVTKNKASISPKELKVGQSLVVYYVSENDISRARRISVRPTKDTVE